MTIADLLPFSNPNHPVRSAALGRPWTRGARSFAADGIVLVSVPAINDVLDNPEAPDGENLLSQHPEAYDGYFHPLVLPCDWPAWMRDNPKGDFQVGCGNRRITASILDRISRLPDVTVAMHAGMPESPVRFRFADDGRGVFMPMTMTYPPLAVVPHAAAA